MSLLTRYCIGHVATKIRQCLTFVSTVMALVDTKMRHYFMIFTTILFLANAHLVYILYTETSEHVSETLMN